MKLGVQNSYSEIHDTYVALFYLFTSDFIM